MKKIGLNLVRLACLLFVFNGIQAQSFNGIHLNFDEASGFEKIGRGICMVDDSILKTKDAYATFGKTDWSNYEMSFKARTPKSEEQVQIWAGFRAKNRNDRYVFGFRGGLKNDLFLARLGYMGADEFLSLKQLDFSPETGRWYNFCIEVCGNRIRIYINDEVVPRLDIIDKNS
jgi:hypothetical protein